MSLIKRAQAYRQDAELDITAFMNLMIVLVPVLLLGMVFSQITVLDLKLPDAAAGESIEDKPREKDIELVIRADGMTVNYPRGILLKNIPKVTAPIEDVPASTATGELVYDFNLLSLVLQEVKRQLREKGIEKRDITLLSEPTTSYQTIVSAIDAVRSYKAVVAASVVDAELFPEVSFGDAPEAGGQTQAVRGGGS